MSHLESVLKPLNAQVHEPLKLHFDKMREVLLFTQTVIDKLQSDRIKVEDVSDFRKLLLYFYFRSISHSISLWLTASNGQVAETYILARPITELHIHLRFACDPKGMSRDEAAAEYFEYFYYLERNEVKIGIGICDRTNQKDEKRDYEKRLKELDKRIEGRHKTSFWPGRPVEQLAKEAGFIEYYDTVYRYYSAYTHTSERSLNTYFDPINYQWQLGAKTEHLDEILVSTHHCLTDMIEALCAEFWRHPFKALEIFQEDRKAMLKDIERKLGLS